MHTELAQETIRLIKQTIKNISIAFVLLLIIILNNPSSKVSIEETIQPEGLQQDPLSVIVVEQQEVVLYPQLYKVCACESSFEGNSEGTPQQFNLDGSVRRGKINPQDIGMCQINEKYWLAKSIELGYDIYTEDGNIQMANYIFDTQGIEAWNWSKDCWDK